MNMAVIDLTKENFEQVVTSNPTVIIDFWAPWCGPCKGFAPVFERVAERYPDVVFAKVNTDEEQEIAAHFQIRSIPTLMVFRDQIIVFSQPGALPESALDQVVSKAKELDMEEVRQQISEQDAAQAPAPGGQSASAPPPTH
jgi:thioredoxin 1